MTFIDDHTVLLSWNQQAAAQRRRPALDRRRAHVLADHVDRRAEPRVPRADALHPRRTNTVYMPWTKGEQVNLAVSRDGGTTWTDCKVASGDTVKGGRPGFAVADHDSAGNVYVVWSDSSELPHVAERRSPPTSSRRATSRPPTSPRPPTASRRSTPASRRRCRSTATPCARPCSRGSPQAARPAASPSRSTATTTDGDPNSGDFKAAWNVYVNQSLNALDADAHVQPGAGDDASVPLRLDLPERPRLRPRRPGGRPHARRLLRDRLQPEHDGRLSVVFDRDNKKPDDDLGHIATPMVVSPDRRSVERRRHRRGRGPRRSCVARRPIRPATRCRATR